MKMVTVKHKPGTITVGDIMETLEKLEKDPSMKISPEMEKSIESLKVFSESIIQPMLNVSSLFATENRIFGQLSDEEQKIIDEVESETRQQRERAERAAGIPEKDCISLDSHIFLCDLPGKSGLYLYKEGKFHFLKLRPMVVNIIVHLYQIRTHPHPRNCRTVEQLTEKFSKTKSTKTIKERLYELRDLCGEQGCKQILVDIEEGTWRLNFELDCCEMLG
jgi:hypothetical protein